MKVNTGEQDDIAKLQDEMKVRRPLPMGKAEFMEWSDRIIQGAQVSASIESQRWMLAAKILELSPTEAFKEDGFFILALRKAAANEVAADYMREIKEAQKKKAEATAPKLRAVDGVLENQKV